MCEKEKVIRGLEHCIEKLGSVTNKAHGFNCTICPYFADCDSTGYLVGLPLMRDALALLKAQEPRVMTLDEVKAAAGHDVWLELSGNIADDALFAATIEGCGTKGLCTRYESLNYSAYDIRPYGWRCWTSRPTDEQMEATPWRLAV